MRYDLPDNHGLSAGVQADTRLVPAEGGTVSLTDVQYEALAQGVARGNSMLVVAPTSTGKTLIGAWAAASGLEQGHCTVYLVPYRALAYQKFEEFRALFLDNHLYGIKDAIVVATGDKVEDASGRTSADPLNASLLIATYEKYLAMLSSGGPPRSMKDRVIICDEMQLLGDKARGQNVEILLTLLLRAGWKQLVGLSAVLDTSDAERLKDWLGVDLVRNTKREKRLVYQCRTRSGLFQATTDRYDAEPEHNARAATLDTLRIVREFADQPERLPIIVFCMRVADTYNLAEGYANLVGARTPSSAGPLFGSPPETYTEELLTRYMPHGIAFHNAELTEEERAAVEAALASQQVRVVFATSTLAAGVNFPLGTAVFSAWKRYDFEEGRDMPISASEFHNMAGRVGRMGQIHDFGLVVFTAGMPNDIVRARQYLRFDNYTSIEPRITTSHFERLILQLCAAGLCRTADDAFEFLASTLSGAREREINKAGLAHWHDATSKAVRRLSEMGFMTSDE